VGLAEELCLCFKRSTAEVPEGVGVGVTRLEEVVAGGTEGRGSGGGVGT